MEKRLPLFLFLALLFYFGWIVIFPPPPSEPPSAPPANVVEQPGAAPTPEQGALSPAAAPALAESEERELVLTIGGADEAGAPERRGAYRARFSNRGARLLSLELADYVRAVGLDARQRRDPANWLPLVEAVETAGGRTGSLLWDTRQSSQPLAPGGLVQALWQMEELAAPEVGVRFRYSPPEGRVVFEKKIAFEPGSWHLRLTLSIQNVSAGASKALGFALVPATVVPAELGDRFYAEPSAVAIWREHNGPYLGAHKSAPGLKAGDALDAPTTLTAVGLYNKYFAFLLREAKEGGGSLSAARYEPVHETSPAPRPLLSVEASASLVLPPEGETRSWEYVVYAGPKDPVDFSADCAAHQVVLDEDLGWTRSIAKALLYVLSLFDGLLDNWGLAIILLTLCVRGILFPLNRRSQTSMARYQKKMKRVQPRLEEAKKKFEGDAQKLREAQARIMQEEGAFPPLGGCLPIFLQMPIFFGLFSALRTSFDLRQAPFYGWIHDLSRPDHLLYLGLEVPILPSLEYLNVLPLLMVVLWILQQMGMPLPADEQAARMQKMMRFMPAVFGLMLYNYAAGLSLYMITTSSCSILEQKVIKKFWPLDDTEQEKGPKKGCGPFSGILQNLAEKQKEQMKRVQAAQLEQRRREGKRK